MHSKHRRHSATAIVLMPALVLLSVGCTTTKMVPVSTRVAPAPGIDVIAVETTTGKQLDFDPPASVVESPEVGFVLKYAELTTFDEHDAWLDRTMELQTIRRYSVLNKQKSTNWLTVIGAIAAFGFVVWVVAECGADKYDVIC